MAWLTTAEVKTLLGISGSSQDAQIAALIPVMTAYIEEQIGRTIESHTVTEQHDGRGYPRLVLRERPVISVTSIKDAIDRDFASATAIDTAQYATDLKSGVVTLDGTTTLGFRGYPVFQDGTLNVQAVYVAGYATVPGDLKALLAELVGYQLNRIAAGGLSGETIGDYSYSVAQIESAHLSTSARTTLARWRDGTVAR